MSDFACRVDDRPTTATVGPDHLVLGGRSLAYVDIDGVTIADHRVRLTLADASTVGISHLARRTDEFALRFREARAAARRAALLQWTAGPPIDRYPFTIDGAPGEVVLFPDGVVVEPLDGPPQLAPLSLVERVERDGHRVTLRLRAVAPIVLPALARRTDEFLADLERARSEQASQVAAAYAAMSERLTGFAAPDGWAVTAAEAGAWWAPLRAAVAGADDDNGADGVTEPGDGGAADAAEPTLDVLERLAGDGLRLGIKLQGGTTLPFALAACGDRVAVEGFGDEGRATYVFRVPSVEWLNAVLLLTSFRREALYLPADQLGRWAVAVRTLELVRQARAALVARVVHTPGWAAAVTAALRAP